jgi:hypothetical protein
LGLISEERDTSAGMYSYCLPDTHSDIGFDLRGKRHLFVIGFWKFSENRFLVTFVVWQSPNSFFIICDFTTALAINNSLYS